MSAASEAGTFDERDDALKAFARPLGGQGIEIGPAHQPFDYLPPGCQVRYVDRWPVWFSRLMFRELGWSAPWVRADIRIDVDHHGLAGVADASQDFVVASHVIEHLANPLLLLAESYRVLRSGGILLVLVPNRHRTFDVGREPTPLAHLIDEHRRGVSRVDDAHVRAFLAHTGELRRGLGQSHQLRRHRRRSIHAHCWDEPEFFEVLLYAVQEMGQSWSLTDFFPPEMYAGCHEFGYLLRRDPPGDLSVLADQLSAARQSLMAAAAR